MSEPKQPPSGAEIPKHAKFSPSGAKRWLNCLGSLTLGAYAPPGEDDDNEHSVEGTAAHALGAYCLNNQVDPYTLLDMDWYKEVPDYPEADIDKVGIREHLDGKRLDTIHDVSMFVEHCFSLIDQYPSAKYGIESRVRLEEVSPLCYGTADFWLWDPDTKTLFVVDYKNGFTPVPAKDPQLIIYGLAAAETLQVKPEEYVLTVVQPHSGGAKEYRMGPDHSVSKRLQYARRVKEYEANPVQPTNPGDWCKWCKAKDLCHKYKTSTDDLDFRPPSAYSDADLLKANQRLPAIKQWIKDVGKQTYKRLMQGAAPRDVGACLNMTSPNRSFRPEIEIEGEQIKLEDAVKAEFGPAGFTPPAIKTPAQLEKVPGGKSFVMQWSYKKPGTLVTAPLDSAKPHVAPSTGRLANLQKVVDSR